MSLHRIDNGPVVLELVDFGHGMASDFRIIPPGQVAAITAGLADAAFCEELSRRRARFRPYRFPVA